MEPKLNQIPAIDFEKQSDQRSFPIYTDDAKVFYVDCDFFKVWSHGFREFLSSRLDKATYQTHLGSPSVLLFLRLIHAEEIVLPTLENVEILIDVFEKLKVITGLKESLAINLLLRFQWANRDGICANLMSFNKLLVLLLGIMDSETTGSLFEFWIAQCDSNLSHLSVCMSDEVISKRLNGKPSMLKILNVLTRKNLQANTAATANAIPDCNRLSFDAMTVNSQTFSLQIEQYYMCEPNMNHKMTGTAVSLNSASTESLTVAYTSQQTAVPYLLIPPVYHCRFSDQGSTQK